MKKLRIEECSNIKGGDHGLVDGFCAIAGFFGPPPVVIACFVWGVYRLSN